jgi:predicted dehydrogenase/threonine dehydrogenase-like Zn-dependent dehydrogenase
MVLLAPLKTFRFSMKQVFIKKKDITTEPVGIPQITPNQILVQVAYSFISSGTEGATLLASQESLTKKFVTNVSQNSKKIIGAIKDTGIQGTMALIKGKMHQHMPLGYSCSGQIIATGSNIRNLKVGDYVACAGSQFANHAEFVSVPENLAVKIPSKDYLKQSSITTIGAIALQGFRRADLKFGESVCIVGLGLLGLITVQLAKHAGLTVYGIDLHKDRLNLAKECGADVVYHASLDEVENEIAIATHHHGVDATMITASSKTGSIIQQAMQYTRRKGKVVLVGDVSINFDRSPFYEKEIDFLISCSYGPGRYDKQYEERGIDYPYSYVRWTEQRNMQLFTQMIASKQIDIDTLISHEFNLENIEQAFIKLQDGNSLGIVLKYEQTECPLPTKQTEISKQAIAYTAPQNKLNLGIIGTGGFCKTALLPIIKKIANVQIKKIIESNAATGLSVASQYEAEYAGNDFKALAHADDINAVVIATPHALHAEQSIELLRAGKALFVEKPAAVTLEELEKIKNIVDQQPNSLYCVDFNRSFSPFMLKIKDAVKDRTNPMQIYYRMNAGYLPQDHWIQDDNNKGRIIGEACHVFELFCFLTGSRPVDVAANAIPTPGKDYSASDNVSIQVSMSDGSICNLLYTSLGNKEQTKEYMELYCDGKSIVMDDYISLTGFGLPDSFDTKARWQDKGHANLLKLFMKAALCAEVSPVPFERIYCASALTVHVNNII